MSLLISMNDNVKIMIMLRGGNVFVIICVLFSVSV